MEQRAIGNLGLMASAVGLGCMGMTGAYGTADESESVLTIRKALDLGVNLFDTADAYGPFVGEKLLGRALAGRRDEVIIATKFGGAEIDESGAFVGGPNGSPEYVRLSVDRSLRNLGTDHIDLYYQHRVDPRVPVEETFGALGELVAAGKIRYLGISEASAGTVRRAHASAPLSAVETEYSLFSRQVESNGVLTTARELGIGFVASSPLGRGFLTGTIQSAEQIPETDLRHSFPRFQEEALGKNLNILEEIRLIAAEHQVSLGQVALAWLLGSGKDIIAIPGTRKRTHLEENIAATRLLMSAESRQALARIVSPDAVTGDRRSPADTAIEE